MREIVDSRPLTKGRTEVEEGGPFGVRTKVLKVREEFTVKG